MLPNKRQRLDPAKDEFTKAGAEPAVEAENQTTDEKSISREMATVSDLPKTDTSLSQKDAIERDSEKKPSKDE